MITLVTPPALKSVKGLQMQTPNPPIGVAYLAGTLKRLGYPYHVVDGLGEGIDQIRVYNVRQDFRIQGLSIEAIVERIPAQTKYIGLSVMFSTLWPVSLELLHAIRRKFPAAVIIVGGEHVSAVPEYCLRNAPINYTVHGEGENVLLALLDALDNGKPLSEVPSIGYLDSTGSFVRSSGVTRETNVDGFARPDWDSIPIENYISNGQLNGVNRGRSMPLITTRGCPFACTFCSNTNMYLPRWIPRNPVDVVDEMEEYVNKYKISNFDLQDLTAFVRKSTIVEFCNEVIKRGLKVTWQLPSGTRSETFDEEVADLVYRAGCRNLAFAPESGDPEILKSVKKQVKLDNLEKAAKIAVKRGLSLSVFIVIGFPKDSPESMKKTLRFLRRMATIGVQDCVVSKFVPYPGSPLFKDLQASGKLALDNEFFLTPMDFYTKGSDSYCDGLTSRQLYRWMLYLFLNFYILSFITHPLRTARIMLKAVFTGYEETRYAKFLNEKIYTRTKWLFKSSNWLNSPKEKTA